MSNLTANYQRTQLRALPVRGGKGDVAYCYFVRVPGGWAEVNHSFTEWAVGDFISRGGQQNAADK
ncbi:hypothetical protein [Lelliottia sp. SL45]|uniref:hypothetical protein n=1 Tax=Lelliottia sp. SL45 TaxID=2994665 RepID=UPI002DD4426C|nr:hypothetical protein [Lelliottia sp. SL45]